MDTANYKIRLQIISHKSQVTLQGSNQEIVINKNEQTPRLKTVNII